MASAWGSSWGSAWGNSWGSITPTVVIDTHDGDKRRDAEIKRFKDRNEQIRTDLVAAYNKTFGISVPDETGPAEMVTAIEENFQQISKQDFAEIERRVLEKLVSDYRKYEIEKKVYDRQLLEEEWDMDAMLAIAHLLQ
mgnify:CR=1 FL=1